MTMLTIPNVIEMYGFKPKHHCTFCNKDFEWAKVLQFKDAIGLEGPEHECGPEKKGATLQFTDEKSKHEMKEAFEAISSQLNPGDTMISYGDEVHIYRAKRKEKKKAAKKSKQKNRKKK